MGVLRGRAAMALRHGWAAIALGFWWLPGFGAEGRVPDWLLPWLWRIVTSALWLGVFVEVLIASEIHQNQIKPNGLATGLEALRS